MPEPSFYDRQRAARELPELTRQIADLLAVGERVDGALETVAELAASGWLRDTLRDLRQEVQGGAGLAEALRSHPALVSEYYVAPRCDRSPTSCFASSASRMR